MAKAFGISDVSLCYINFPIWVSSTSGIKAKVEVGTNKKYKSIGHSTIATHKHKNERIRKRSEPNSVAILIERGKAIITREMAENRDIKNNHSRPI